MDDLAREYQEAREAFFFWHERCLDMQRMFGRRVWRQQHAFDMEMLRMRSLWKGVLVVKARDLLAKAEGRA